jgi:hypothetical protein
MDTRDHMSVIRYTVQKSQVKVIEHHHAGHLHGFGSIVLVFDDRAIANPNNPGKLGKPDSVVAFFHGTSRRDEDLFGKSATINLDPMSVVDVLRAHIEGIKDSGTLSGWRSDKVDLQFYLGGKPVRTAVVDSKGGVHILDGPQVVVDGGGGR